MKQSEFLAQFTTCAGLRPELPDCFHLALQQLWAGSRPAYNHPDSFLRDYIFNRTRAAKNALFLHRELLAYLNAPATLPCALPLTRFMAMVFDALGSDRATFNLQQHVDALRFYHTFVDVIARRFHLPLELIPETVLQTLQQAGYTIAALPGPLCRMVHERNFLETLRPLPSPLVTLIGPATVENGLGQALRYMADGFEAAEIPFAVFNAFPQTSMDANDTRHAARHVAVPTSPINMLHFNSDVLAENLLHGGVGHISGRYNIGYFVWETSRISRTHAMGIRLVDEIWVPSEFTRQLYARETDKPIFCHGSVVNPPAREKRESKIETRQRFGLPQDGFLFIFTFNVGSRLSRKNPLDVIAAFNAALAHEPGAHLVLKTHHGDKIIGAEEQQIYAILLHEIRKNPRIHLINQTLVATDITALLSCCDAYVSLHHGEGFGYGMAEAMALGLPVIATGWSGNADYVRENIAYPVAYKLVPVQAGAYHYADKPGEADGALWAEPSLESAANAMRDVFTNPQKTAHVAIAGQAYMQQHYSAQAVGARMRKRLAEIMQQLA